MRIGRLSAATESVLTPARTMRLCQLRSMPNSPFGERADIHFNLAFGPPRLNDAGRLNRIQQLQRHAFGAHEHLYARAHRDR